MITARKIERRPKRDFLAEETTPLTAVDLEAVSQKLMSVASELAAFYGGIDFALEKRRSGR